MSSLTLHNAISLIDRKPGPAVSIYLGTDVRGHDSQGQIRRKLDQLFESAMRKLFGADRLRDVKNIVENLETQISRYEPRRERGGVAFYQSADFGGMLHLPTPQKDLAVAADSFHLKPVLRCRQLRRSYFFLLLRKKRTTLYSVDASGVKTVENLGFFTSADSAHNDFSVNSFSKGITSRVEEAAFWESLNDRIQPQLRRTSRPLVIAGRPSHVASFRSIIDYPHVVDEVSVDFEENVADRELIARSAERMESYFAGVDDTAIFEFEEASGMGMSSTHIPEIATLAVMGQVEHLLVAEDRHLWGSLDRVSGDVKLTFDRNVVVDDVLDDLAEVTLLEHGRVTVLPSILMPRNYPTVAILRGEQDSFHLRRFEGYCLKGRRNIDLRYQLSA